MAARVLVATWQEDGFAGCARKVRAAAGMSLPRLVAGRRTARSVGAYFDLITDDGRLFYGDSFHFGYFPNGQKTLAEGARRPYRPRRRARPRRECQGRSRRRVRPRRAGAPDGLPPRLPRHRREHQPRASASPHRARRRARPLRPRHPPPGRRARARLPRCLLRRGRMPRGGGRHLRHRGRQGAARRRALPRPAGPAAHRFSDLAFRNDVSAAEDREVRAVLYHSAAELITDRPALFTPRVPARRIPGHPRRNAPDLAARLCRSTAGWTARCSTGTVAGSPRGRAVISADSGHPRCTRDVPRVRRLQAIGNKASA